MATPPSPEPLEALRTRPALRPRGPGKGGGAPWARARWAGLLAPPWLGRARRGGPHRKGEVRWLPPPPRFVARRKMADLEEQLSDEEKVRAAGAAEPVGPGASGALEYKPGGWPPAKGIGLCPRLPLPPSPRCAQVPAPVSHPRPARGQVSAWPARSTPCRVCALKIGSGSRAAAPGATGGQAGGVARGSGAGTLALGLGSGPCARLGAVKGSAARPASFPRALPSLTAWLKSVAGVKGKRQKSLRKQTSSSPF